MKSYVFQVVVEDDALETPERRPITPIARRSKGATRGGARTTKPWRMCARQSSCTLRIYANPDLEFRFDPKLGGLTPAVAVNL